MPTQQLQFPGQILRLVPVFKGNACQVKSESHPMKCNSPASNT